MTFLAGWAPIAIAAGLTIPPLVALYFLKLRRVSMPVSSTLLWKRAVEDLQVNAPFQRIRNNLLLWLQLLVLALAALALGKPIMQAVQRQEDTVILLVDQSASMNVVEADGKTRLEIAKEQAATAIDNMPDGSRAMIIGFCDRATIVSGFETDKQKLKDRIDALEATESSTTLSEALTLAEAYMQDLVIGGEEKGSDIEVRSSAGPARVVILSDSNVEDASRLSVKRLPTQDMQVVSIGERSDNVGILSLGAKRNYERPEMLEVFASVRNFSNQLMTVDANLYIDEELRDVQTMVLRPGRTVAEDEEAADDEANDAGAAADTGGPEGAIVMEDAPPEGSVASLAFDEIEYGGSGVVEVRLTVDDALAGDNAAWAIIPPPRNVSVLYVTEGNPRLEGLLRTMPLSLEIMTPARYEAADDEAVVAAGRSKFDVVIIENHATQRLPVGNYLFMGGVPLIEGVEAGEPIRDEIIFNWDESHPIMRYVSMENVQVQEWLRLSLPPEAIVIMEGESSPVMAYLAREGSQYLIGAFGIWREDDISGRRVWNTDWFIKTHFPVFVFNVVRFLSGSMSASGMANVRPGEPVEFAVPEGTDELIVRRPDGTSDRLPTAGFNTVNYARTRLVGEYQAVPGIEGHDRYAVNLFNPVESDVTPRQKLSLSGTSLSASEGVRRVNKPFWPWLLVAIVVVLVLEWAIYSKRVFV